MSARYSLVRLVRAPWRMGMLDMLGPNDPGLPTEAWLQILCPVPVDE